MKKKTYLQVMSVTSLFGLCQGLFNKSDCFPAIWFPSQDGKRSITKGNNPDSVLVMLVFYVRRGFPQQKGFPSIRSWLSSIRVLPIYLGIEILRMGHPVTIVSLVGKCQPKLAGKSFHLNISLFLSFLPLRLAPSEKCDKHG